MIFESYVGKRFAGLLVCVAALVFAYFAGDPDKFSIMATTLGILYGAFVTGQSVTDVKENGKNQ